MQSNRYCGSEEVLKVRSIRCFDLVGVLKGQSSRYCDLGEDLKEQSIHRVDLVVVQQERRISLDSDTDGREVALVAHCRSCLEALHLSSSKVSTRPVWS